MKLELKENMYVRTKDGYISQYKYYDYDIGEGLIGKLLCIPLSNGTFANIENIKMYCSNRNCPYLECVRHDRNIPFNVLIKREDFKLDKDDNCKHKLLDWKGLN